MIAGIFCGETKPKSISSFLAEFTQEVKILEHEGILFNGVTHFVRVSCIIADAPARSFFKCIKTHNAYHSCERCEDEGEWEGRVIYSAVSSRPRTDSSFFNKIDTDHHVGTSPLAILQVGLVSQTVLDYMHLICLGVVRKLINLWISGPLKTRVPNKDVEKISQNLCNITKLIPGEFGRKPRSLKDIKRFKATEFRLFLLYTSMTSLKNILPVTLYNHFMLLQCSMYILLSKSASQSDWNQIAKDILQQFVHGMVKLYGKKSVVYNVHGLLHISNDALNYGNLDNVSAFSFENYMQFLKKLIRGQKLHLEQIVKRVSEFELLGSNIKKLKLIRMYSKSSNSIIKISYKNFIVSVKRGDNYFLTNTNNVIKVVKIFEQNETINIEYKKFTDGKPVREYPINSMLLGIRKLKRMYEFSGTCNIDIIRNKCVILPYPKSKNLLAIPMLEE